MRYESRAVYFEHKYIVDNPYLTTLHELHLALMAVGVYGEADACARVYVSCLGKELYVKRHTLHVSGCLLRIEARDSLSRAWVVPLPFLHKSAQLSVRLCDWSHCYSSLNGGNSRCMNLSISLSFISFTPPANSFLR